MSQKKNYKVYVVDGGMSNGSWIEGSNVRSIEEADVVVFTGGQDVTPALYGESNSITKSHSGVKIEGEISHRDQHEKRAFEKAVALGKTIWGNCRGVQFMTAMVGGKLIQDVNHPGSHILHMWDNEIVFHSNSCHHQMCYPFNLKKDEDYYVLASTTGVSRYHHDGNGKEMELPTNKEGVVLEPEMVYYPKFKALGFQGHIEWMDTTSKMARIGHAFLNMVVEGNLENALKIGLTSKQIFERAWNFKFTEEEQQFLQQVGKNQEVKELVEA